MNGVQVYGRLHRHRLHDAFYRREAIFLQAVTVLASAMIKHDNQEQVMKQLRKLGDLVYPEDPEAKARREEMMSDVLKREGRKSYKVVAKGS